MTLTECQKYNISNGIVSFNGTVSGSVARQKCEEGFILIGTPLKTCLKSGNWTGTESKCSKNSIMNKNYCDYTFAVSLVLQYYYSGHI